MFEPTLIVKRLFLAFAALLALGAGAAATVKTEYVEAYRVADKSAPQPGKPLLVGLKLRMEPQWHTYWKNPGDSGLPTKIQWVLPEGWKASEIQWPYPQPLPVGPLMNYGYEDEVVLLSELTPPASATAGTFPIKARAEWLGLQDNCLPEKSGHDTTRAAFAAQRPDRPRPSTGAP